MKKIVVQLDSETSSFGEEKFIVNFVTEMEKNQKINDIISDFAVFYEVDTDEVRVTEHNYALYPKDEIESPKENII